MVLIISRRQGRGMLLGSLMLVLLPLACLAQGYPTKPIFLIVPFPPGGVADIIARPIAERLTKSLGQPMVVESRGGATGTIGASYVARAAPDGYTLLLGTTNEIAMSPTLYQSLPYDPTKAFAPVTPVAVFPNVLVVGADTPVKTLAELVALARAKPGTLNFGSSGVGSTNHLTAEIFQRQANVSIVHVPYRGGGPALTDVSGGHITAMSAALGDIPDQGRQAARAGGDRPASLGRAAGRADRQGGRHAGAGGDDLERCAGAGQHAA